MKNKLCFLLVALFFSFSFVDNVYANNDLEFSVTATADNNVVVKGDEASVKVNLKSDSDIYSCRFVLEPDSSLEYVSKDGLNGWNVTLEGPDTFVMENSSFDSTPLTNGMNVLEIKYKVKDNSTLKIKVEQCVNIANQGSNSYKDVSVNFIVQEPADDTTLKTLTVNNGQISPTFDPLVYENYVVNLRSPNFSLTMTASNSEYQDKIVVTDVDGNTLDPNNLVFNSKEQQIMPIYITVNNSEKKYSLGVAYVQENLDNSLSSLSVNGISQNIEPGKYDYEFKIGSDVKNFELSATIKDSDNFQFAENSNKPGSYSVTGDSTYIVLIVEPISSQSGGVSATYNIEVIREGGGGASSETPSSSSSSNNNSNGNSGNNATTNPSTGGISMFIMAFILMTSLGGSIYLYQKNLEGYK